MLKSKMFSLMPVNETCADSNLEVEYLPDLITDRKIIFMLRLLNHDDM
jgi:hypothetical protein